jgi:hypothetical protein
MKWLRSIYNRIKLEIYLRKKLYRQRKGDLTA